MLTRSGTDNNLCEMQCTLVTNHVANQSSFGLDAGKGYWERVLERRIETPHWYSCDGPRCSSWVRSHFCWSTSHCWRFGLQKQEVIPLKSTENLGCMGNLWFCNSHLFYNSSYICQSIVQFLLSAVGVTSLGDHLKIWSVDPFFGYGKDTVIGVIVRPFFFV